MYIFNMLIKNTGRHEFNWVWTVLTLGFHKSDPKPKTEPFHLVNKISVLMFSIIIGCKCAGLRRTINISEGTLFEEGLITTIVKDVPITKMLRCQFLQ